MVSFFSIQIYSGGHLHHFVDGYDVHHSNWMRYVNPARSLAEQNLVACQNGQEIFFYTIQPVEPKQELLVWYSPEFSQRLCGQQEQPDSLKPSESWALELSHIIWHWGGKNWIKCWFVDSVILFFYFFSLFPPLTSFPFHFISLLPSLWLS